MAAEKACFVHEFRTGPCWLFHAFTWTFGHLHCPSREETCVWSVGLWAAFGPPPVACVHEEADFYPVPRCALGSGLGSVPEACEVGCSSSAIRQFTRDEILHQGRWRACATFARF